MTKRHNRKNTGTKQSGERTVIGSAYSYYSGVVRTSGRPTTAVGVKRLFAAALLSGASMMAVGLAGTGPARAAGSCLPQAGEGEQILCIGTFDETIAFDVEDVTVVLGEGAIVDTTDNHSESFGSNIGIVVDGEGYQTVVNDGTVLTGDGYAGYGEEYDPVYGENHGIVAYANEGYDARAVNSETGIIGTTGERGYGIFAEVDWGDEWGEGTASAVNDGSVSTTGESSSGVVADGKYADVVNTGTI